MEQNSVKTRKRGNRIGVWFFKLFFNMFGIKGCYVLLLLVVPYYILFDRKAVLSVMPYIEKRFPETGFICTYKHIFLIFLNQGKQLINRYIFLKNEELFTVSLNGYDVLSKLLKNSDKGFIILNSHIGNWQLAVQTLKHLNRTVHIVMRAEENMAVQNSLQLDSAKDNIKIIYPSAENLGGVIEIANALLNGDIVAITGDRSYGADVVAAEFLGKIAFFPYSAFKIAADIKCPITVLLTHQKSQTEYTVDLNNLLFPYYSKKNNKSEQLKVWVQEYADIITAYTKEYPYDCFIFCDIWKK